MWTNGRADVSRSVAKSVFSARVGRRSTNSRGPGVERSEVREWSITQGRRLTAIVRDLARAFRGRIEVRIRNGALRSGPPSERQRPGPRARTLRRGWRRDPERALGAALASGPDGGVGDLATRVVGYPVGVEAVKSPRLALERLQCNNSATLFAQRARGKSGRLEVWRAPGEKGASLRRAQWMGGCCVTGGVFALVQFAESKVCSL